MSASASVSTSASASARATGFGFARATNADVLYVPVGSSFYTYPSTHQPHLLVNAVYQHKALFLIHNTIGELRPGAPGRSISDFFTVPHVDRTATIESEEVVKGEKKKKMMQKKQV